MRLLIDLQGAQGGNQHRGIGRLTRALARAMVSAPGIHEPLILLNDALPESAEALSDEFAALLPRGNICFWRGLNDATAIGGPASVIRRQASERIRAHAIAALRPDVIYASSVFEGGADDTITNWPADLQRPPHVATFYDAIPLINREQYLRGPWQHLARWYLRQVQEVRRYDGLMAISESSRREALDHLGFGPEWVFNVRAGFDKHTFRPIRLEDKSREAFLTRYNLREGYLLFVGAGDPRKNELGLLHAYCLLPERLRVRHQLVIVGAGNPSELQECAAASGLRTNDLLLLRHVSEQDLPILYSTCGLFVMPSKHEGFGLPALEAMACGAPVIASSTTSLPEVVGLAEALFDPNDPKSIAERIKATLQDDSFRLRLVEHGLSHVNEFTWEESARKVWAALETMEERGCWRARMSPGVVPTSKLRLALFGELPASSPESACADLEFVSELARHYDVTLFASTPFAEDDELGVAFANHAEDDFPSRAASFDRILYRVIQSDILIQNELLPIFPGVVISRNDPLDLHKPSAPSDRRSRDAIARDSFGRHGWPAIAALYRGAPCDLLNAAPFFPDALAVIKEAGDPALAARAFAEHCCVVLEDAYVRGTAAQRQACVRALGIHDLPGLASAIVKSFPVVGPERLLLSLTCIEDDVSLQGLALREEVRRALVEPERDSNAEIVCAEGGILRLARARAAVFLGLPLHGLPDEAFAASSADTLVLRTDVSGDDLSTTLLHSFRRRGAHVIALVLSDATPSSIALSVVDGVICATEALARAVLVRFENGMIERRYPVKISWPGEDGKLLHVPSPDRWPLCWHPRVA